MDVLRFEYDSTLEDIVDANMRLAQHTETYRKQRRQSQWLVGGCSAAALVIGFLGRAGEPFPAFVAIAVIAGVGVGAAFGFLYGGFHDSYTRRSYARMVREMYRGVDAVRCEFEIRPDVLWTRTQEVEITLPWSKVTRVTDAPDAIEVWFDPGLAVVRNRAFKTAQVRQRFLDEVRTKTLSAPAAAATR